MTDRMFPFITKTWSPIAGGFTVEDDKIYACPYRCGYCWACILINKFPRGNLGKKYTGPYRIHEPAMKEHLSHDDFVFVQCMSDIGASCIPTEIIKKVLTHMKNRPKIKFLLLTKNPAFYSKYKFWVPPNCILGATIETDIKQHTSKFSKAPNPINRINYLKFASQHHDIFVSVEPIMKFSKLFVKRLRDLTPWAVAVGYDNYNNNLPEPELKETLRLISGLKRYTTVYKKTIRERRNS